MRKLTMPRLWDEDFLKDRVHTAMETTQHARSEQDWQSADILIDQAIADVSDHFRRCPLQPCRRAHRCVGNPPVCLRRMRPNSIHIERLVEHAYICIQQERRAAAAEHRTPDVLRPIRRARRLSADKGQK